MKQKYHLSVVTSRKKLLCLNVKYLKNRLKTLENQIKNLILLTREAIETALLQLLEKKELAKISISELVKRAGVSRAAFYRNYD